MAISRRAWKGMEGDGRGMGGRMDAWGMRTLGREDARECAVCQRNVWGGTNERASVAPVRWLQRFSGTLEGQ